MFVENYAAGETPEPERKLAAWQAFVVALTFGLYVGIVVGESIQDYRRRHHRR